ncbi:PTB domain-containing engulfment adapter protein 1-like [Centruroides vittatus]|uniref:PTB domain-containing engulfment adapter protein 1-like n=1 Tax=Centruroides vittatus TaxID=120091 RepID=UPI00350F191C
MIKQSSLLKRTHSNKSNSKQGNKHWIHSAEALKSGHVVYLVKFLGSTEVEQAKGIDVVKEGIRKLKFNQQVKRADGTKIPKVELTISIDGVAIQEPKAKKVYYTYPLHRISYCADDKSDKKFFSFIAKEIETDKHKCFVFVSDKLAEEITLTIGQAFDLAYRRFLETFNKDLEMKKRCMILQKRVCDLTAENAELKKKISEYQQLIDGNKKLDVQDLLGDEMPTVGRRLENLLLADMEDVNTGNKHVTNGNTDLFGAEPFNPTQSTVDDPFGMGDFSAFSIKEIDLENAIGAIDKKLLEMRDGFSCGLSFGNDDFSADILDTSKN